MIWILCYGWRIVNAKKSVPLENLHILRKKMLRQVRRNIVWTDVNTEISAHSMHRVFIWNIQKLWKMVLYMHPTEDAVREALEKGPYGRCVFHSDNTVVDHQTVDIEFENQVTASFLMTAFTNQCARRIRIMGTKGELKGDMEAGTIEIIDFVSGTNDLIQLHTPSKGHSGSDMSMMREFVRMVGEGKTGKTDASVSVASHLMALAAEEARISRLVIDFEEYSTYEMK